MGDIVSVTVVVLTDGGEDIQLVQPRLGPRVVSVLGRRGGAAAAAALAPLAHARWSR